MKTQISPAVAGVIVAVVVLIAGFFFWKSSQAPPKEAKGGFEFKLEKDPVKMQAGLEKLKRQGEEAAKNP